MRHIFRGWLWCLAAWLAGMAAVASAQVESFSPVNVPSASARESARFDLVVLAPDPLREFLLRHLALQRFRTLDDLDAAELSRLIEQVPSDVSELLATQGYMSPTAAVEVAPPVAAGTVDTPRQITVHVTPGPVVRVSRVRIDWAGDIATHAPASTWREAIEREWALVPGHVFTQSAWDQSKAQALRSLTAQRYPGGRIDNSLAQIDVQHASVDLVLTLDSGPPWRLGEVEVSGVGRYEAEWVRRLVHQAGLTPGSDYDQSRVLEAQRRVAASAYFDSVFVFVDPADDPGHAPVKVKVREARTQKLVLGVGGSTDNGPRLSLEHTHHRVPGLGWRAVTSLNLERENRTVGSTLSAPVDDQGWAWVVAGRIERQRDADVLTDGHRVRAGQSQDGAEFTRGLFVQLDRTRSSGPLQVTTAQSALSVHYSWRRRRLDSVPFPEEGHTLAAELGAGMTLESGRQPYLRGHVRVLAYEPLAAAASGRLALRGEVGAVLARPGAELPSSERFLTGGDNTVRGYGLRAIGVPLATGGVAPGRYLALGSVEWQRPLNLGGQRSAWEATLFMDAGAVGDSLAALRARVGVGLGARYRSPVGPLQLDLAYGVHVRRWRLHLALGLHF